MSNENEIVDVGSDTDSDDEHDWYFASQTAEIEGPYMESELRILYQSGKIDDSTHVWNTYENDLHRDWIPIIKIKHLYPTIFTLKPDEAKDNVMITQVDNSIPIEGKADAPLELEPVGNSVIEMGDKDPFAPFPKTLDDEPDLNIADFMGESEYVSVHQSEIEDNIDSIMNDVRGPSEVKRNIGEDNEKATNLHKPEAASIEKATNLHKPEAASNASNFDSVMKGIEALEDEMKMQDARVKSMDLNPNQTAMSSDDETTTDGELDTPIQMNFLDPNFAILSKPAAAVHRFTLEEAWSEEDMMLAGEKKVSESEGKFSILLVGNKLRKLDNILPNHKIAQLRKIVGRVEKVASNQVMLLHKGESLNNDSMSLTDYNISNGGTVVVRILDPYESQLAQASKLKDTNTHAANNVPISGADTETSIFGVPKSESSIPESIPALPSVGSEKKLNMNSVPAAKSEEDLVLEAYPSDKKKTIRDLVKAGFPQDSVIVALEITNFSKDYAMEWLLSDEMALHRKHETQRQGNAAAIHRLPQKKLVPQVEVKQGKREVSLDEVKSQSDAWGCPVCTFENLTIMPYCEMCGFKKNSKAPPDLPKRFSKKHMKQDLYVGEGKVSPPLQVEQRGDLNLPPNNKGPNEISISALNVGHNGNLVHQESIRGSHNAAASKNVVGSDRGNLKITLIAAVGLANKANYCLLTLGKLTKKTKPLKKSKSLEFNEVFFFNGFKPERSRQLRIALMVENKVRADKVVGQVSYAMPTAFNTLSHDCIELTNQKNQTAGLLIISVVIRQLGQN